MSDLVRAAYTFGTVVYLRVREKPVPGMVTAIVLRPGSVSYVVTWGDSGDDATHYDFELSTEFIPDYARPNAD
jgi:hypothetical protein